MCVNERVSERERATGLHTSLEHVRVNQHVREKERERARERETERDLQTSLEHISRSGKESSWQGCSGGSK